MNTTTSYTFAPGKNETSRSFEITVQPHSLSNIAVTNLRIDTPIARSGRALTSATISYEATGVAETSVQIRSATGHVIRHLLTGRAVTAGVNQAIWDLKDDQGRVLSTGTYLIEVQAHTADNRQTRATAPYTLIR
jgi:flagellar hook assembly protein FlgD